MTKDLTAILLLAFCVGCAGTPITITAPDSTIIEIDPGLYGRGCSWASLTQLEDGSIEIDVVVAQDGSTDWSLLRLLDSVADVAGMIFGGGQRQMDGMAGPSPTTGCAQLVDQATIEEE